MARAKRDKYLMIRLSQEELESISRLAESEKLPTGTFIRRLVLLEAERQGIKLSSTPDAVGA